jgi:hypothetical protein
MAVFYPYSVKCVCNQELTVHLAESVNVKRFPKSREQILKGEMHRAACPNCGRRMTIEKPFYYTDLARNSLFKVLPRGNRHHWKKDSAELNAASNLIPAQFADVKERKLRVVFGMDELREKLVAEDAGLDDRIVELLKVLLIYEHPILLRRPRLRLLLDAETDDELEFSAAYEHHQSRFRLALPKPLVADLVERREELETWAKTAHPTGSIFELPDHWVNIWRWSPQPTALDLLEGFAEQLRAGEAVDLTLPAFEQMLRDLPRGTHLPGWAKRDLRTVFESVNSKQLGDLEERLFEIRFGFELDDDWAKNQDPDDIDTLWQLLKNLPDTHVEGNTRIHEIILKEGKDGGFYDPQSHDITIGSINLANREKFEDTVRHEVGHAVHEMNFELVNRWLQTRFGWRVFEADDAGIDEWITLLGGWGNLTPAQQSEIRGALRRAVGRGESWSSGPTPSLPVGHPWYRPDFAPRLAFENTGGNWFRYFNSWFRINDRAFFLNYWYGTFMVVDTATLNLVARMPDSYAAMSHFEFFAELYALNYDLDDPKRKEIPEDVSAWFDDNLGGPESNLETPAPQPKKRFETIIRPDDYPPE